MRGSLYLDGGTSVFYRSTFGSGEWQEFSGSGGGEPEADPIWSSASNFYYQKTESDDFYVDAAGDTMTGELIVNAEGGALVIGSTGLETRVGGNAAATGGGTAVGREANAYSTGTAVGYGANGSDEGTAVGHTAAAAENGSAMGYRANGSLSGAALGSFAIAPDDGVAVGAGANGSYLGAALGREANAAGTNIAIGAFANAADGFSRTAIGASLTNEIDNSTAVRGSLYLDGGTSVFYRSTFGSGAWQEISAGGGSITETDPVFAASAAFAISALNTSEWSEAHGWGDHSEAGYATGTPVYAETDPVWVAERSNYATGAPLYEYGETDPVWDAQKADYATGTPVYVETDPVWDAEKSGYATGTPLYVFTETDPVWVAERSNYATGAPLYEYTETDPVWDAQKADYATGMPVYVETDPVWDAEKSGYATGTPLYAFTETDPVWTAASNDIQSQISNLDTAKVSKTGDTMTGTLTVQTNISASYSYTDMWGTRELLTINGGDDVQIGNEANGYYYGVAVGFQANGYQSGAAAGAYANGSGGVAMGYQANNYAGVAVGFQANGYGAGAALGRAANGQDSGVAIGWNANGTSYGVAVGNSANAGGGGERIAIGHGVTNPVNNSAAVRGTLYLDGGTGVYYRSTFGSGAWVKLLDGIATGTPLYAFTETDPVWTAEKTGYATGMPVYVETDPVWTAEKASYATGTPLYVYSETDPVWTAVSNDIQSQISAVVTAKVSKTGDTMTGALTNSAGFYGSITLASDGPAEIGTLRYAGGTVQFYDGTNWIPVNAYAP